MQQSDKNRKLVTTPVEKWGGYLMPDRLQSLMHHIKAGEKKILDYGCGQGAYVHHLRSLGYDVIGVDIAEYSGWMSDQDGAQGKNMQGSFIKIGSAPHLPFKDEQFDVVYSFEVLEHCKDPLGTLVELKRICKNILLLSVPDCSHIMIHRFSLACYHWTDPTHIQFFTRSSVVRMIQEAGLTVAGVQGSCPIDLERCYWDNVCLPSYAKKFFLKMAKKMKIAPNNIYSSILVTVSK